MSRHAPAGRALARRAYQTFEPYHLVAYFGPAVEATQRDLGIGWLGSYTGMRAAPLGVVPAEVVTATFYGFRPEAIAKAWGLALAAHTPAELNAIRTECVDTGLRAALGDLVDSPELAAQADRLRQLIGTVGHGGRALSAAYAALPWPEEPHLSLWHAATVWREWRGDAHNAALVANGVAPLEALVLYDADLQHREPQNAVAKGRQFLQPSRRWTDEEWASAASRLVSDGLVTENGSDLVLTEAGTALRQEVEDTTDDASAAVWIGVGDAEDVLQGFRPFSKAVIVSGILPGTTRR